MCDEFLCIIFRRFICVFKCVQSHKGCECVCVCVCIYADNVCDGNDDYIFCVNAETIVRVYVQYDFQGKCACLVRDFMVICLRQKYFGYFIFGFAMRESHYICVYAYILNYISMCCALCAHI